MPYLHNILSTLGTGTNVRSLLVGLQFVLPLITFGFSYDRGDDAKLNLKALCNVVILCYKCCPCRPRGTGQQKAKNIHQSFATIKRLVAAPCTGANV